MRASVCALLTNPDPGQLYVLFFFLAHASDWIVMCAVFFSISHAFSLTCSFADKMHTHQSCLIDFLFSSGFFSLCIFPFRLVWPRALRSKHFLVPFVCVALSGRSLIYIEFTIHPHSHTITSMHTLRDYCLFDEWFGCLCMPHIRWLYCFIT